MPTADELRFRAQELRQSLPQRREATPPEDQGRRLATVRRASGEELRISWAEFEGRPFLSIRFWKQSADGGLWPDRQRGVAIRVHELAPFAEAVAAALDIAEADQQHQATRPTPPMPGRKWNAEPLPTPEPPADGATFTEFGEVE